MEATVIRAPGNSDGAAVKPGMAWRTPAGFAIRSIRDRAASNSGRVSPKRRMALKDP